MEEITIAGYEAERKELDKIAAVFSDYASYQNKGVTIPRGLMLTGAPGTGKTLFARALAKKTNAAFFDFHVRTNFFMDGSARLKKVLKKASKSAPAIVFIDEIDRYISSDSFHSDSSNSFLASLLTCLDGFSSYPGVMVIGATSNEDDIPDCLTRSGRMDVHIHMPLPNKKDRMEILNLYLSEVKIPLKVNSENIACKTQGFSGADIKTLVNSATTGALVSKKDFLEDDDFLLPIRSIVFKDIKHTDAVSDKTPTAYHEIGHLIVAKSLLNLKSDTTIDSFGDSLGSVIYQEFNSKDDAGNRDDEDDDSYYDEDKDGLFHKTDVPNSRSVDYYLDMVSALLAGRASEEVMLHKLYTGCSEDITNANNILITLILEGDLGLEYVPIEPNENGFSEGANEIIRKKAQEVMLACYSKAKEIIEKNKGLITILVRALLDKTLLTADESEEIIIKVNKSHKIQTTKEA